MHLVESGVWVVLEDCAFGDIRGVLRVRRTEATLNYTNVSID